MPHYWFHYQSGDTHISDQPAQQQQLHQQALLLACEKMPDDWQLVASSGFARVACNTQHTIFYKEFLPRSPLETLKALLRGSRATRARKNNDALNQTGIDAPKNLAWGKLPGRREYLFSSAVEGAGVTDWLRTELSERTGEQLKRRRELLHGLGVFIGRLHATGFIHGDLRTSNVLAGRTDDGFRFSLIDNERNIQKIPPPGRGLLRNLMQLNMLLPSDISQRDRMRFFCSWRRQMRDLSRTETNLIGVEAYQWAMRRLRAKGKIT